MRKLALWIVPICLCLLIAISYLPNFIGAVTQVYLRLHDVDIKFKTIVWKENGLVITDLEAKDPFFSIYAKAAKIQVFDRHVSLLNPVVQMTQIPEMKEMKKTWTYSVENGLFVREGFTPVSFSIEKKEKLNIHAFMDNGWISLEKGEENLEVHCHQFPLSHLNLEGVMDGTFQMHDEEIEWDCDYQGIHCFGKGSKSEKLDAELRCGDASVFVHANDTVWEISADAVPASLATQLLNFAERFGIKIGSMDEGVISGSIRIDSGNIKIKSAHANHLRVRKDRFTVFCEEFKVSDGEYFFNGGSAAFDGQMIGTDWEGRGDLEGSGSLSGNLGSVKTVSQYVGTLDQLSATLQCDGWFDGTLEFTKNAEGWNFALNQGKAKYIDDLHLRGELRDDGITCYDVKGILDLGKKVAFHCPILQSNGRFDIRFLHPIYDIARLCGTCHCYEIAFDLARSHFLGSPVNQANVSLNQRKIEAEFQLPWKFVSFFTDLPAICHLDERICCQFTFQNALRMQVSSSLFIEEHPIPFTFEIAGYGAKWQVSSELLGGTAAANLLFDGEGLLVTKGIGKWDNRLQGEFSGRIHSLQSGELNLSNLQLEMGLFRPELQGTLSGDGILHWKGPLEADLDLIVGKFKVNDWELENAGSLHIFCSSTMGVVIQGLNVAYEAANCKIGLLQYKFCDDHPVFSLTQSQFYVPSDLLAKFGLENFAALQGVADLTFSSDLSKASLSMKEGLIPFEDEQLCIRNLHAIMNRNDCKINFDLDHHSRFIPIDLVLQMEDGMNGRLMIENGLKIDWTYKDKLCVQSIEGKCTGVDASFHLDGETLIGSAQINGNELKNILPEKIAQVFDELKIGNGYELMGRLNFKNGLGFKGILSGKQIELFGFELRNMRSQIEWDKEHLLISDLKISDFAGVLKVEKVLAQGVGKDPWTLSIPKIIITELRPSLLQDVGGPPGKLSPLVVREIKIEDFQGRVDDSKTYTAKGELFFINSYKRENSILEIPSDLLSRIIGLDIELLTPVCGTLKYELHDGFFHFTELAGSYSENKRSEFFLVFNDDSPKMDLDWNLNIFIQTKQFVLFKFTEAFLISVTGKLDAPKFQLQRKKRFLGVL